MLGSDAEEVLVPGLWAALLPALPVQPWQLPWPHSSISGSIGPQPASLVLGGAVTWLRCPECLSSLRDPLLSLLATMAMGLAGRCPSPLPCGGAAGLCRAPAQPLAALSHTVHGCGTEHV